MTNPIPPKIIARIKEAIALIGSVPGYEPLAAQLSDMLAKDRLRYAPGLEDRGQAGLTGIITLGHEPFAPESELLGLAETLVHEAFHLTQNPLEKTVSFWKGVFTQTDVMQRYEEPAYNAALEFLRAYAAAHPDGADTVTTEIVAIRETFSASYGKEIA